MKFINRELSWLSFNARVLQEAADKSVPLIERFRFLGIFSNNLDEFFRVRVASVTRMKELGGTVKQELGLKPKKLLKNILNTVQEQQEEFGRMYRGLKVELEKEGIFIIDERKLTKTHSQFIKTYFDEEVSSVLFPIMISQAPKFPYLKGNAIYLAIVMEKDDRPQDKQYALLEIPTHLLGRFLVLPEINEKKYIILLDDVIRHNMDRIFNIHQFDRFSAYTIKLTRDSELDLADDLSTSFLEKVSKSVRARKKAAPVRLLYDATIPEDLLDFIMSRLQIGSEDSIMAGDRYHNFKDFIGFPNLGAKKLTHPKLKPIRDNRLNSEKGLLSTIAEKDLMLHFPYEKFSPLVDLLREASIDPTVESIKITLYRVASNSRIINALISAALNGKHVEAILELQARFDEEANIYWANELKEAGAEVVFGVPGIKVHAKLCMITRRVKNKLVHYCNLSTGNFNEKTANIYTDHSLFTARPEITSEVDRLFQFLRNPYRTYSYKHLIVSPFHLRSKMVRMINAEIRNAKAGKPAAITMKMNSLLDKQIIGKLYQAGNAGVKLKLIVRGICSLVKEGFNENADVQTISVVDKFLEHPRIYMFHNGGDELLYIASADMMPRNLDRRVEVACPIYDKTIKKHIKEILNIQLNDNVKARDLMQGPDNIYIQNKSDKSRSQVETYNYLKAQKA